MGVGYDTVNAAFLGQLSLNLMIGLVIFKLLATTFGLGMGLPAGLIGPTLVIGAGIGGIMGLLVEVFFPGQVAQHALYAMLGMGAMMGATLQAPLAALIALLELTNNPNLILPGMLVIVVANLVANNPPLKKDSVFIILMRARGLEYWHDPISQSLSRIGVAGVMERNVTVLPRYLSPKTAKEIVQKHPVWIIVEEENQRRTLLRAADLARFIEKEKTLLLNPSSPTQKIDLLEIPAERLQLVPIELQASLLEALQIFEQKQAEAIYIVRRVRATVITPIYGILTHQSIETYYRSSLTQQLK
jgi:CIC family chloride channel protein